MTLLALIRAIKIRPRSGRQHKVTDDKSGVVRLKLMKCFLDDTMGMVQLNDHIGFFRKYIALQRIFFVDMRVKIVYASK